MQRFTLYSLLGVLTAVIGYGVAPPAVQAECRVATSVPTYEAGQLKDITCDIHGAVAMGGGGGSATAAAPSLAEGSAGSFSFDLAGNARVTQGTLQAGEDLTATGAFAGGVQVIEKRYLITATKTADFQVKASAGYVNWIRCIGNDAAATVGTIKIFDSLTETGTELFSWTTVAVALNTQPLYFPIEAAAATGIYLGYTTIADIECQVSYR
jgi:hypothetical protein